MQRLRLFVFLGAVSIPAAALWAGSPVASSPSQYAVQIASAASRLQSEADGLQGYVRSGAHDQASLSVYAHDMNRSVRTISSLVEKVASEPGVKGEARAQTEKMKLQAAGLRAMVFGTVKELSADTLPAHAEAVFADSNNIINRSDSLRTTAESFSSSN